MTEDESRNILDWVQRLYALAAPRRFAEHALLVLLDAVEAPAGYVVFRTDRGGTVGAALRGRSPRRIEARLRTDEVAAAAAARFAETRAVRTRHDGVLAGLARPISAPELVSLRLFHAEADCDSLWVLGRGEPFAETIEDRLRHLQSAVTYAGDLMLPRLPGGPRGFYTRVRIGPPDDDGERTPRPTLDLLTGLPAITADCARLAARGYTNREIAVYLLIKESAVSRHLSMVYRHLGIDGRHQLDVEALLRLPKPLPRRKQRDP